MDRKDTIAWTTFFEATLPGGPLQNCVMAPVNDLNDLRNIAIAAGEEQYSYVGVRKPAKNLFFDNNSRMNWFNLDGTSVPSGPKYWADNKPDNKKGLQAYAIFSLDGSDTGGRLDDIEDYKVSQNFAFNKAVMKCCGDIPKTFCPAEGDN